MNPEFRFSRTFRFILPALVGVLLVLLVARVLVERQSSRRAGGARAAAATRAVVPSSAPAHPPAATVPPPKHLTLAAVPAPARWNRLASSSDLPRLDFTIDLDYFAPLGDGPANAAVWLRDFARSDGSRAVEVGTADLVPVQVLGMDQKVYPPDHPLLREAEPWMDQATCRFYPDIWMAEGPEMRVANLLLAINLARSWAARGAAEQDPGRAREDFRRSIRLGRLLMQEDLSLIQELVGWACVSYGLRGLNAVAQREGDGAMVAATTLALGDYEAMRGIAAQWSTELHLGTALRHHWWGGWSLASDGAAVDRVVAHARGNPLRCWRVEAIHSLALVEVVGDAAQQQTAAATLSELAKGDDPMLAALARWYMGRDLDVASYADLEN